MFKPRDVRRGAQHAHHGVNNGIASAKHDEKQTGAQTHGMSKTTSAEHEQAASGKIVAWRGKINSNKLSIAQQSSIA